LQDAVLFVLEQENASRIDLLGYSWGTARSARFALAFPQQVRRLALYAPVWRPSTGAAGEAQDPDVPHRLHPALGGYATFRAGDLQRNWDWEIGVEDPSIFRTDAALEAAESALLDSDADLGEPGFRAPLGPMVDALGVACGGSLFDAPQLRHEVLLVRGAQDRLSSDADARALFEAIGSMSKRLITIGWGTHLMHIERSAGSLIEELVGFFCRCHEVGQTR
jgi:pimeloyl-ACP methyl ester carboxylesterase